MPYIKQEDRKYMKYRIKDMIYDISDLAGGNVEALPGILNYVITTIALGSYQKVVGEPRYKYINDLVGVLECAKMEIYRRVAAPYEREAMKKNGDLPEFVEWKADM